MGNFQPLSIGLIAFFSKRISEGTPSAHLQLESPFCAFLFSDYLGDPPLRDPPFSGYCLGPFSCCHGKPCDTKLPKGRRISLCLQLEGCSHCGREGRTVDCDVSSGCICIREAEDGQDLRLDSKASRPAPIALLLQRNHLLKVPQPSTTDPELRHTGLWRAFYI